MSDSEKPTAPANREKITGVILAGGQASRMNYQDKGLIKVAGQPMASWVKKAMNGVVGEVIISCNRHFETYQQLTNQVIRDCQPEQFQGPLAGVLAAAKQANSDWIICIPTDTPLITEELLATWINDANLTTNPTSYLQVNNQGHYLHCLVKTADALLIENQLQQGKRKVMDWLKLIDAKPWQVPVNYQQQLININNPKELAAATAILEQPK